MKKYLVIFLIFIATINVFAESDKATKVTTTFLVFMDDNGAAKIKKALKAQKGIKKMSFNMSAQTIEVTFLADENTVSNLVRVIRAQGYSAVAQETGCFGSKEGCINAMKPENIMP